MGFQTATANVLAEKSQDKLEAYLEDLGAILKYPERKASFSLYALGLLSEGERKSVEPIAARAAGNDPLLCQRYHDRLCHFLHGSRWDDLAVRHHAVRFALAELTKKEAIDVAIIDDTGFLKQGHESPGVQRQYTGSAGKVTNCQIAVSLVVATRTQHLAVDMDLFLPESWTEDPVRMNKAHVPLDVGFRMKWQIALDLVTRALQADIPLGVMNADAWYGNIAAFRGGLTELGLLYTVAVNSPTVVRLVHQAGGDSGPETTVLELAKALPLSAYQDVVWRQGTQAPLHSRFARVQVRVQARDASEPEEQELLIEWPYHEEEPNDFTLLTLPLTTSLHELVRITKQRWRTERTYQDLKGELGLDHFEGRTYPGWQHHISVVLACYAFVVTVLRRAFPPSAQRASAARTWGGAP